MYFRKSCNASYVNVPSETKPGTLKPKWLGASKVEADKNLERLNAGLPIERPGSGQSRKRIVVTVQMAVDAFLDAKKAQIITDDRTRTNKRGIKQKTYDWYVNFLHQFCDRGGTLPLASLEGDHVDKWIAANPDWTDNTAHCAARSIIACCNWVVETKATPFTAINESPLKGYKKVKPTAREFHLEPADWKRLIESKYVDDSLRDAIMFMRWTGCRPTEMRLACKRHFRPDTSTIVFAPHEWMNGRKTGEERVIQLSGDAFALVQKLCFKHPDGPIFRNRAGRPWKKDALAARFGRLREKLSMPELVPYTIRHTFATEAVAHVNSVTLAKLMGTSVAMLERVYSKAGKRQEIMAQAAKDALRALA